MSCGQSKTSGLKVSCGRGPRQGSDAAAVGSGAAAGPVPAEAGGLTTKTGKWEQSLGWGLEPGASGRTHKYVHVCGGVCTCMRVYGTHVHGPS